MTATYIKKPVIEINEDNWPNYIGKMVWFQGHISPFQDRILGFRNGYFIKERTNKGGHLKHSVAYLYKPQGDK